MTHSFACVNVSGFRCSSGAAKKYVKAKKTSQKITKLTSKKKYYVRIRAYTSSGGVIHVSKWSKTKTVKAK